MKQDRGRRRSELKEAKEELLELFKQDTETILASLKATQNKEWERVYGDAWDSAKASGRLAILSIEEYRMLSKVYLKLRSLNDWIGDAWLLRTTPNFVQSDLDYYRSKVLAFKNELGSEIIYTRKKFGWFMPREDVVS